MIDGKAKEDAVDEVIHGGELVRVVFTRRITATSDFKIALLNNLVVMALVLLRLIVLPTTNFNLFFVFHQPPCPTSRSASQNPGHW